MGLTPKVLIELCGDQTRMREEMSRIPEATERMREETVRMREETVRTPVDVSGELRAGSMRSPGAIASRAA